MATPGQHDSDSMSESSREYINDSLKEGTTPESTFSDWGDCDGDHTAAAAATANGRGENLTENAAHFFASQATGTVHIPGVGGKHES